MKKIHALLLGTLLASFTAASAFALGPVDLTVKTDYASRYIWRGYDAYGNGDAFQPSATATVSPLDNLSLSLNVWASYDMDNSEYYTEIDYTGSATYTVNDQVSLTAGYIYYYFPRVIDSDADDTKEVFISAAVAPMENLAIGLSAYYDHDNGKGYYFNGSADYTIPLTDKSSIGLGATVGYMSYDDDTDLYLDENGDGFNGVSDVNLRASVSTELYENLALSVTCTYTIVPDDDINEDNEFWTLASLAYSF